MGYYIEQTDCKFFVPSDKIEPMIQAIRSLANKNNLMGGGSYHGGEKVSSHYSWVDMKFATLEDIAEIFYCWRWTVERDEQTGDIVDIYFSGEKLGDDFILFKTIAPFVKTDSFIEIRGEDNAMWRWHFNGEKCVEKTPTITWD